MVSIPCLLSSVGTIIDPEDWGNILGDRNLIFLEKFQIKLDSEQTCVDNGLGNECHVVLTGQVKIEDFPDILWNFVK